MWSSASVSLSNSIWHLEHVIPKKPVTITRCFASMSDKTLSGGSESILSRTVLVLIRVFIFKAARCYLIIASDINPKIKISAPAVTGPNVSSHGIAINLQSRARIRQIVTPAPTPKITTSTLRSKLMCCSSTLTFTERPAASAVEFSSPQSPCRVRRLVLASARLPVSTR